MRLLRTLSHLLLALAVVVNAGWPAAATAAASDHSAHTLPSPAAHTMPSHAMAADAMPPCHESGPDEPAAATVASSMDCCSNDGGGCTCSCLHHASVAVLTEQRLALPPHGWVAQLGRLASLPATPNARAIRPPIA